jgi:sugar phosphate permease
VYTRTHSYPPFPIPLRHAHQQALLFPYKPILTNPSLPRLPSNLVIKKLRPSNWIAFITIAWGIIATLTGLCRSYGSLIACRLLLGAVEGGLFPGLTIYLTLFYTKREIALRIGYLFVSAALAGGLGGLLAYGIGFLDHTDGLRGWRWIMIIEGLPTFVLGIATWWWLADEPESAYYLTREEKALMVVRKERQIGYSKSGDHFHKEDMMLTFKDWKVWVICVGQFGADAVLYGYSTFLPTIIKGLGKWTTAQSQALTVPCYAVGAITYLLVARLSDHQQRRGLYATIFGIICVVGYGIMISDSSSGAHFFGCFVIAAGLYAIVGIPLSWLPSSKFVAVFSMASPGGSFD